jgi:hypothetical protein
MFFALLLTKGKHSPCWFACSQVHILSRIILLSRGCYLSKNKAHSKEMSANFGPRFSQ